MTHNSVSDWIDGLEQGDADAVQRGQLEPDHPDRLETVSMLALLAMEAERYDEAERFMRETLDARRLAFGADHRNTLESAHNLAALYRELNRFEEAETLFRDVLERRERTLGATNAQTLRTMIVLGRVLADRSPPAG